MPDRNPAIQPFHWNRRWRDRPYVVMLADLWNDQPESVGRDAVEQALAWYAMSQDVQLWPADRMHALESSFDSMSALCRQDDSGLRLASLARIARDLGERRLCVGSLDTLWNRIVATGQIDVSEPFIPAAARFDWLAPGDALPGWLCASVLETLELTVAFSSCFAPDQAKTRLDMLRSFGFWHDDLDRRLRLVNRLIGP